MSGLAALCAQPLVAVDATRFTNSTFPTAFNAGRSGTTAITAAPQDAQPVQLHSGGMELTALPAKLHGLGASNVTYLDAPLANRLTTISTAVIARPIAACLSTTARFAEVKVAWLFVRCAALGCQFQVQIYAWHFVGMELFLATRSVMMET